MKDYLRIRLSKIDKYIYHIIKNDLNDLLSKTEFDFAFELFRMKRSYFAEGINKKINDCLNDFKPYPQNEQMIVAPPSNSYVCFKSVTFEPILINFKDVWEESIETLTVNRDEVYCLPLILVKLVNNLLISLLETNWKKIKFRFFEYFILIKSV